MACRRVARFDDPFGQCPANIWWDRITGRWHAVADRWHGSVGYPECVDGRSGDTLSDVLNNTATTIVAAPVALQMAATLRVNPIHS
ncbi:MAG: hypothetical protein ACJA1E_000266 [Paracoccaceae bacterium]|jgi:hypothetical protein